MYNCTFHNLINLPSIIEIPTHKKVDITIVLDVTEKKYYYTVNLFILITQYQHMICHTSSPSILVVNYR